ncbi:MAG: SDR family oxidoreductase [Candidatus Diapherotrites archaeon]|nr:SDR family oxidoreductase [Candidatus Diapherotrites archaeon]
MDHGKRVALVCGASKGLGFACAETLLRDNARVCICSHNEENLEKAEKALAEKSGPENVFAQKCDLNRAEEIENLVERAVKRFGRVDILVNNTGGPKPGTFFELSDEDFLHAHEQLLLSVARLNRRIVPLMAEQGFGRVINLASLTVKEPNDLLVLSNVYRAGVVSLSKSLSREFAHKNVFINSVLPGAFKTDRYVQLMERRRKDGQSIAEVEKEIAAGIPMGRLQSPQELAELVSFLASDKCFLTGVSIQADGGKAGGLF